MRLRNALGPALFLSISAVTGAACSSHGGVSSGGAEGSSAVGPVARFSLAASVPDFLDVPYPSDLYLKGGKIIEPVPGIESLVTANTAFITHELAKMNGFSRSALTLFRVDDGTGPAAIPAAIAPASLPEDEAACIADTSSVFLIDLAATDAASARLPCRALFHDDIGSGVPPVIALGPARGYVLAEGHTYAAVLTSRVKDTKGRPVQPSADFASVAKGSAKGGAPYVSAYPKAKALLASALASDDATIVSLAVYTTNAMTADMFKLRAQLDALPAPTLAWDPASLAPMGAAKFSQVSLPGFTATLDDWLGVYPVGDLLPGGTEDPDSNLPVTAHDKIAAVGTAVFTGTNYLQDLGGYQVLDHATFTTDSEGNITPPAANPTEKIWVSFAIPTAPMPPAGYPVVIIQHGLNGSRSDDISQLNVFAAEGWIVAFIDSVTFGARAPEAMYQVDTATDYEGANGAVYSGPDGFSDAVKGERNGSSDLFGSLQNLGAFRDQMRQAELDTVQLVRVLRSNPDLSPLATSSTVPAIDPSRIAYVGQSLGGIQGAVAAAIEPAISLWALNVAGAGLLIELGAHAPAIAIDVGIGAQLNFGIRSGRFDEGHPIVNLIQQIVDPGDPISFAGMLVTNPGVVGGQPVPPRNVLQFEALFDEIVGNEANEALARAGGWGMATPNQGSNAGYVSLTDPTKNHGIAFAQVSPDATGAIHDTPVSGITAVLVQEGPATHGMNMLSSTGERDFSIPFAVPGASAPFEQLLTPFDVPCPYRTTLETMAEFIADGFAGRVPNVTVKVPPVRDTDGDSYSDDIDQYPNDPTRH